MYVTAEAVNVWNGMETSRWVRTGSTRYLTNSGEFILTQDIIADFAESVGDAVHISADGSDEPDGIGSVIAPVQTPSRAMELLSANDTGTAKGTIAVIGDVPADEPAEITAGMDVVIRGASGGGTIRSAGSALFSVQGGSLTLADGITLTGSAGGGSIVAVDGGVFAMQDGSAVTGGENCTGGAVRVNGGTFTVSGAVQITGNSGSNVYLASGQTITDGGLAADARIGVSGADTDGDGLIPVTDTTVADAAAIFSADAADCEVFAPDGTAVYLADTTQGKVIYMEAGNTVPAFGSFADAVSAASGWTSGGTIMLVRDISAAGSTLTGGSALSDPTVNTFVALDLNGHTLTVSAPLVIYGYIEITDTSDAQSGRITGAAESLITVNANRELRFSAGTVSGNTSGRGVSVNGGTFTMTGGAISGNTSGCGVSVNGGTFTMTGGAISGNTADTGGGGVYVYNGMFTMSGGEISGNITDTNGGGVYVSTGGTFIMIGGAISGNTAGYDGGGVHVYTAGTFEMSGGEISGNAASGYGGGVYVYSICTFEMTGGKISGNTADTGGGGVYVHPSGTFTGTVDAAATVTGNTPNNIYPEGSYKKQ